MRVGHAPGTALDVGLTRLGGWYRRWSSCVGECRRSPSARHVYGRVYGPAHRHVRGLCMDLCMDSCTALLAVGTRLAAEDARQKTLLAHLRWACNRHTVGMYLTCGTSFCAPSSRRSSCSWSSFDNPAVAERTLYQAKAIRCARDSAPAYRLDHGPPVPSADREA